MNKAYLTVEAVRGFVHAIPKSEVRWYLCGLFIEFDKGRAVVTDGHSMIVANIKTEFDDPAYNTAIISREDLADIARGGKKDDWIIIEHGKNATLLIRDSKNLTVNQIEGSYPDYERVMPDKLSGELAHYNPSIIFNTEKALRMVLGLASGKVASLGHNGTGPGLMGYAGMSDMAIAVVMPMRDPTDLNDELDAFKAAERTLAA